MHAHTTDRSRGAPRSLAPPALLALALACASGSAAPVPDHFDSARAWKDLETLVGFGPRPVGSQELELTRQFLATELAKLGLEVQRESFEADTPLGKFEMANVYADFEGKASDGQKANMVLLVSHFDTKRFDFPFVGANDGGSSTAVLLELARAIVASGSRDLTYRFLFVDGEEATRPEWAGMDHTYGSRKHAENLRESPDFERVKACVLLDLVGDKDLKIAREMYSDSELLQVFFKAAREAGLGKHVNGPRHQAKDDHLSFMRIGIRSVDLIDFDYGPNNDWWHTAEDTLDKCSQASLEAIGRIVLAGLPALEEMFAAR